MTMMLSRITLSLLLSTCAFTTPLIAHAQVPSSSVNQEERWTINLKDAPIRDFIDQVSTITGQSFVVDPRVKGQVTVVSNAPITLSEVYQLFLSVMSTHGYTVVTKDGHARVIPNAEARVEADTQHASGERLETRVLQIQHSSANELIPLIRPLVAQYGHMAAVSTANALIISDRSANIDRIADLIRQVDQKGHRDYSVVNLQHAWVMDTAAVLRSTLERGEPKGVSSGTQIVADARTNRLIILGPDQARAKLVALAQSLDTPTTRSANTRVIRLRHNDAKSLAETLGELSEGLIPPEGENSTSTRANNLLIRADESLNALVLVAEPDVVAALEDIVRQLDVPRAQVLVEAAIVEVSGDINDALGVQWAIDGRGNRGGLGGVNFSGTGLSVGTLLNSVNSPTSTNINLPDGAIIGVGSDHFGALITALSTNSKSNLLSTPSLLTLDNQKAEILVGQNVPFQTGSYTTDAAGAGNPFTTIERKDIGVTLKVTPHINDGATLRLQIEQEISSIAPNAGVNAQAVDLITNKCSIKSTILAEDGQVIVLGGLIQDDVTRTDSKVPVLGDIPILGRAFRSSRDARIKRNLMVFLRPTVVRDAAGIAALTGRKYSDVHIYGDVGTRAVGTLPHSADALFEPAIDLRQ